MWDNGVPAAFRYLLTAYAGYVVVRATFRWSSTVRVLGLKRSFAGVRMMIPARFKQVWVSDQHSMPFLPIGSSVPVLFELQVFAYVLFVVVAATWRRGAALAFFESAFLIPAAILTLARASECILPPCILYLGVSEPGQFASFRSLAASRNLLTVSALDQDNIDVSAGQVADSGMLSSMLWPDWIGRVPTAVLLPRRRLESIRVRDDAWEGVVRQMIGFVPLAVIDLRSWSAIVAKELGWYLRGPVTGRAVLLTREDGSSSVDGVLGTVGANLRVKESELSRVIDDLEQRKFSRLPSQAWPEDLARGLERETRIKEDLLAELEGSKGLSPELDLRLLSWALGEAPGSDIAAVTSSIAEAVKLIRRRIPMFSYTIHVGADGTAWTDIGVQTIPGSFRVSISSLKEVDHPAKALMMSLIRAELGVARGISRGRSRIRLLREVSDPGSRVGNEPGRQQLWALVSDLRANNGTPDPALEGRLANWCGIARMSSLEDLDPAIRAVLSLGEYSMAVYVRVDGTAWAEVAAQRGSRWFVAFSFDPPSQENMRPAQALLAAALKAELQLFDGVVSQR